MIKTFKGIQLNEDSRVYVETGSNTIGTVQFVPRTTASTVVITIKCSNSLDAGWSNVTASPTTISSSSPMTVPSIDLGFAYLAAEVTTKNGSAANGDIIFCLKE